MSLKWHPKLGGNNTQWVGEPAQCQTATSHSPCGHIQATFAGHPRQYQEYSLPARNFVKFLHKITQQSTWNRGSTNER